MRRLIKNILIPAMLIFSFAPLNAQEESMDSIIKKAYANVYNNPDDAINSGKSLLKSTKESKNLIRIYLLLSTANTAKRDFEESLKYIFLAKKLAEQTNDEKIQIGVYISTAVQFQQMEIYSKSLENLDKADEILQKAKLDPSYKYNEIGRSSALRGMIYKSQSNPELALAKLNSAIENFNKVTKVASTFTNQSIVQYNIGYCYLELNQLEKSEKAFAEARKIAKKINAISLEAFPMKGISEVYKRKNKNIEAVQILKEAESLSANTNDLVLLEGINKELADNNLALGNQEDYLLYIKKYQSIKYKREQNELNSINHTINTFYKDQAEEEQKYQRKSLLLSAIIIGVAFILILILVFFLKNIRSKNIKLEKSIQSLIDQDTVTS